MSILIVDDKHENLHLLDSLLSGYGHSVKQAMNGKEALDILRKEDDIELIISDVLMPVMDGFQLCREVHNDEQMKKIPFIFYTATYTSVKDIEFGKSLGADQYIIKPMAPDQFIKIIEESLKIIADNHFSQNDRVPENETLYLKQYNVRLIEKLENKLLQLEESELRYTTLLNNSLQAILLLQNGKVIFSNELVNTLTGYSTEEISRMSWTKLNRMVHPEDRGIFQKVRRHKWDSNPSLGIELRFFTKSKGRKWAEILISRIILEGAPAFQITALDITTRRESEENLRKSKNQLRTILNSMEDFVFLLDADGKYMNFFQPGKENLYFKQPQDFIGKHYSEVLPPKIAEKFDPIFNELKSGGKFAKFEYAAVINKEKRWYHARISSLFDDSGSFMGIVIVSRDITSRKMYEEKIEHAKNEWENTFNSISDVVLIMDKNLMIQRANKAAEKLLTYDGNSLIGQTCYQVFHGANTPCDHCSFVHKENSTTLCEQEIEHRNTKRVFQISCSTILNSSGELKNIVQFARDITEFKQLQRQYIQAQKMEAIGKLAGGIAHDFNNILTVIEGYSDLVLKKLNENDPLHKQVFQILSAGERARRLTQQLLAFSRKQILQPEIFNLNELIDDLLKMLKRLIGEDVQLITHLEKNLFPILADYSQIEQVIINLAVNSRDAMPNGGKLIIETQNYILDENLNISGSQLQPGDYVLLMVSDTGSGMPKEIIDHCFDPFFTTKEVGKGTGLGLSTVHGIIEQSGGFIKVYSEEKYGTTFKIYIPATREKKDQTETPSELKYSLEGKETILLVEDEELVRNLGRDILQNYGYTVIDARNGTEALLYAEKYHEMIHLLLTDIIMPQMNGWDLAKKLQKTFPNIKILFMSGYSPDVVFQDGKLPSNTSFIQKPFLPKNLALKIRKTLDQL